MTSDRKPTAAFWITVALVAVLVGYPLSFGPACWITSRTRGGAELVPKAYRPITWFLVAGDSLMSDVVKIYAGMGAAHGWVWYSTVDAKGNKTGWEWGRLGLMTIIKR